MPNGESMFETVKQTADMTIEHETLLKENVLPRLDKLEDGQEEIRRDVKAVRSGLSSMELTVMKDGALTREILTKFVDHYFTADSTAFQSKDTIAIAKLNTKEKVWLGLIGVLTGGGMTAIGTVAIAYFTK